MAPSSGDGRMHDSVMWLHLRKRRQTTRSGMQMMTQAYSKDVSEVELPHRNRKIYEYTLAILLNAASLTPSQFLPR
jgi:hypothetical protein